MKLRTFTALLLAAIMLFALTACGSQAADDSSSDQQQEQQDTTTNESNEFRGGGYAKHSRDNALRTIKEETPWQHPPRPGRTSSPGITVMFI